MATENATAPSIAQSTALSSELLRCAALSRAISALLDDREPEAVEYAHVLALELAHKSHEAYMRSIGGR